MSLRSRLAKLERARRCRCGDGVRRVVAIRIHDPETGFLSPMPEDLPPGCPVCGGGQVVLIEELVVVGGPAAPGAGLR
jgi:hypothetical protein